MSEIQDTMWDTIIVGGGAAALSAAIYAARREMKTLVIAKSIGGQALMTQHIENYPGILERIAGPDLLQRFWKQAEQCGAKTIIGEVVRTGRDEETFFVETITGEHVRSRTLILAFGMTPRNMDVPGEEKFFGRGVHSCVTCDGPLYKGKTVAVVGGGNSGMDAALFLAKICPKVYLVYKGEVLKGDAQLAAHVMQSDIIDFCGMSLPKSVRGDDDHVNKLVIDTQGKESVLAVEGIFVEMGFLVKMDCIRGLVDLNEKNEVVVDVHMRTSTPGVFACGDLIACEYKQIVVSAGQGATAALEAYKYLQQKVGKPAVTIDWTT